MSDNYTTICFSTLDKSKWLEKISSIRQEYNLITFRKLILLEFIDDLDADDLEPIHLVTLACLIQFFHQNEHKIYLSSANDSIRNMLFSELRFQEYWSGGKNHVDSTNLNFFNLWRVVEAEKDLYAKNVEKYFRNTFFKKKDLSAISLSMIEAYYNVFDHAEAQGNAFSLIKYDEEAEILNVAISDFGKGISKSVRDFNPDIKTDKEALLKSVEINFTVKSKAHNKGKGLDNILSCSSVVRIFSNNALLLKRDGIIKIFDINFHFHGTLIYFEIPLSLSEDEEILEEFEL